MQGNFSNFIPSCTPLLGVSNGWLSLPLCPIHLYNIAQECFSLRGWLWNSLSPTRQRSPLDPCVSQQHVPLVDCLHTTSLSLHLLVLEMDPGASYRLHTCSTSKLQPQFLYHNYWHATLFPHRTVSPARLDTEYLLSALLSPVLDTQ